MNHISYDTRYDSYSDEMDHFVRSELIEVIERVETKWLKIWNI